MKFLKLVFKNLMRNRRRSILTMLSVALSLFIFSIMMSLPALANRILAATASSVRMACHNKAGVTYGLPEAYGREIAKNPHVTAVVAQSWFGGVYHEVNDQFPNFAVDHEQIDQVFPDWGITPAAAAAFKARRTACLVGPATMQRFGLHVGQQIALRGTVYPFNVVLDIVGELGDKAPPSFLMFRRDYLEEIRGRPGYVNLFWLTADKPESVQLVIAQLDETFANSEAETQTEAEAAFLGGFLQGYRMIFTMAEILGLIVVFTIGLVAANTAAMSIRERRGEIAVMRSMGFSAPLILSMLVGESLIVGLVGGILGCGIAYLALRVMVIGAPALGPFFGAIRMPPVVLLESLLVAALLGMMSGFIPARAAARQNIVDALRTA